MNKTVYNIETGEKKTIPGIDAKEYIETGGWSYDKPDPKQFKASNRVDAKAVDDEVKAKTSRKRKS